MPNLFQNYGFVIMDASFFVAPFSREFCDGIADKNVWVSEAFLTEIEQFQEILTGERLSYYKNNIAFVTRNLVLKEFNAKSAGDEYSKYDADTWGLINFCISLRGKVVDGQRLNKDFVIVTSNIILISRLVYNRIPVDYYDLNANRIIHLNNNIFDVIQESASDSIIRFDDSPILNVNASKYYGLETRLYTKRGTVLLAEEIKSGAEGTIYRIKDDSSRIAKIYKEGELRENKFNNLNKMVGMNHALQIEWAIFPEDILYFDHEMNEPAGFVEKYVQAKDNLGDNPLYIGNLDIESAINLAKSTKVSNSLELCIKVVRQVCYLNCFGFYISDFNAYNFSDLPSDKNVLQMWDADSFGYQNYFSGLCPWTYMTKEYDLTKKSEAMELCNEALISFVFQIMSLGDSPIGKKGNFRYDNPKYACAWKKCFFPLNTYNYLRDIYVNKKDVSPEALLKHLVKAKSELIKCGKDDYYFNLNPNYSGKIGTDANQLQKVNGAISETKNNRAKTVSKAQASTSKVIAARKYRNLIYDRVITCHLPIRPVLNNKQNTKVIRNALKSYAPSVAEAEVLAVLDTSLLKNGKTGFIFTQYGIYSSVKSGGNLFDNGKRLDYSLIAGIRLYEAEGRKYDTAIKMTNGSTYVIEAGKAKESLVYVLDAICQYNGKG